MLDKATLDHYREKGWVVINDVFDAEEVDRVRDIAMDIGNEIVQGTDNVYLADKAADGTIAPRKIDAPFHKSEVFKRFVTNPRLSQIVGELMGVEPLLHSDQIFMKPPRFGSAKPYHQDNAYFECTPADHVITAWIALDDCDEANGCLRYIDGSHREGIIPHVPVPGEPHNQAPLPEDIDLSRESLAIVKKGGVVFHHSETLHTSHRNESDRWRRGYATHWIAADVTSTTDLLEGSYHKTLANAN